jgi:hypothetical protein
MVSSLIWKRIFWNSGFKANFLVKRSVTGEHMSRCIARISGEKGKTKNAIENATRTRIVLADSKIHIMGKKCLGEFKLI